MNTSQQVTAEYECEYSHSVTNEQIFTNSQHGTLEVNGEEVRN